MGDRREAGGQEGPARPACPARPALTQDPTTRLASLLTE